MLTGGAFAKNKTISFKIVYIAFIIALKAPSRKGSTRQIRVPKSPAYKNKITSGLTIMEAIIPTGMSFPKRLSVTGAVKIWAPVLSLKEEAIFGKKVLPRKNLRS